ncbi:hypothetical protein JCGZ_25101 [Jatropha curcas]|uniref:Uncharacterized protein n=1 Tax=Jatropha curcas TaxID=180498 RepID=A0A067JKW4_JATCU|nr:hypothetical protein JCGZ_25101 [Jatropha curcas]
MSLSIPTHLSFSKTLSIQNPLFLPKFSQLSLNTSPIPRKTTIIRMGGGPRTYPGGVSRWQWKRMQAKKAKQLLKARLCRERQIYEMRKRAELQAAVGELERPWEVVEKAPNLFSVGADEQVKVLADRFQRPGGFDLWSDRDGPRLFATPDCLPSARFFPKGVVHSVRPYGKIVRNGEEGSALDSENENGYGRNLTRKRLKPRTHEDVDFLETEPSSESEIGYTNNSARKWSMDMETRKKNENVDLLSVEDGSDAESGKWGLEKKTRRRNGGEFRKQGNRSRFRSGVGSMDSGRNGDEFRKQGNRSRFRNGVGSMDSGKVGLDRKQRGSDHSKINSSKILKSGVDSIGSGQVRINRKRRGSDYYKTNRSKLDSRINRSENLRNSRYSKSEVFDMSLQQDGSYGFQTKNS